MSLVMKREEHRTSRLAGLPLSSDRTMVATGSGKRQTPKAVAVIALLVSPALAYLAYTIAFVPAPPNVFTCTRTNETSIVCQPGDLKGGRAELQKTGKHSKNCFTLTGDPRSQCVDSPGVAASAVDRANGLAVGASAELDLTDHKNKGIAAVPLFFAITMLIGAALRLLPK